MPTIEEIAPYFHPYLVGDANLRRYWVTFDNGRLHIVNRDEFKEISENNELIHEIDHDLYRVVLSVIAWDKIVSGEIFDYWKCKNCGEITNEESRHKVEDFYVCDECFEDDYRTCEHCHEAHHTDDMTYICDVDYFVCESCKKTKYVQCDNCGDWFIRMNMIHDDSMSYCEHCFDHYFFRCDSCGDIFHNDNAYGDSSGTYCESCYNDRDEDYDGVHDYDYVPSFILRGEGVLHFGTEMEIDDGDSYKFKFDELSDVFYCKQDGSLHSGFEIVSHPMTYDWIMENTPFKNPISLAKEAGFKSNDTSTCGLHIHMSRKAFGEGAAQDDRITSFIYFFEKFWSEIVKFSRRTRQSSIDSYCRRFLNEDEFDVVPSPLPMKIVDETKKKLRMSRYMCVNITNTNTVEVRIFKGSLNENTIIASIQLCKLFYELSVFDVNVIESMTWDEIKKYAENDYPELIKAFEERGV